MVAATSTGASVRRISGLAARRRWATRSVAAANSRITRISRSGRTRSSITAGSEPVTMNALSGQPPWQTVHGTGSG